MELCNQFYTMENSDLMDIEGGDFWGGLWETVSGVATVALGVVGFIVPEPVATKVAGGIGAGIGVGMVVEGINEMTK